MLLVAGFATFELTTSATLTVLLLCGKFGWNDLRTALWLRRKDPDVRRGRVCAVFYMASALWKVSLTAVAAMFTVVFLAMFIGLPRGDAPPEFVAAALLAAIAPSISSVVTWLGVALARRYSIKVWIEPAIHRARRERVWPPHEFCRANQAGYLLIAAILCPAAPLAVLSMAAACIFLEGARHNLMVLPTLLAVFAVETLMAVLALSLKERVARAVVAMLPEDCWRPSNGFVYRPPFPWWTGRINPGRQAR